MITPTGRYLGQQRRQVANQTRQRHLLISGIAVLSLLWLLLHVEIPRRAAPSPVVEDIIVMYPPIEHPRYYAPPPPPPPYPVSVAPCFGLQTDTPARFTHCPDAPIADARACVQARINKSIAALSVDTTLFPLKLTACLTIADDGRLVDVTANTYMELPYHRRLHRLLATLPPWQPAVVEGRATTTQVKVVVRL